MLIGLTGAIGGGKSTALAAFSALNIPTDDADRICHRLYQDRHLLEQLSARWGNITDAEGRADRKKIGAIVFKQPEELEFLTGLLYPMLEREMAVIRQRSAGPGGALTVVEIPLLFECGWEKYCDVTAALWTGSALRHERLLKRGLTLPEIAEREARQWSEDRKLETADHAVINTGTPAFLQKQCKRLIEEMKARHF